jgi:hypothetical protein
MTTRIEPRTESRTVEDEVARLDRWLAVRAGRESPLGCTIRAANEPAVAEVARRHGYVLRSCTVEEPGAVWAEFRPVD